MNNLCVKLIISILINVYCKQISFAQTTLPDIYAGPDIALPCNQTCASLLATNYQMGSTLSYDVNGINYNPFQTSAGTTTLLDLDDVWSDVVNLPFTFCFFGQSYNKLVVGGNGLLSFDTTLANTICFWNTMNADTMPTSTLYTNSIMGPYHDIDPSSGGKCSYQVIGNTPYRVFIVSYDTVPMFDNNDVCFSIKKASHQIALYETTNVIDVFIKEKQACPNWNNGLATLGIQNATGTLACVAPGKNNSIWNATNEAWRFMPNGSSIVTVDWLKDSIVIGVGDSISVCTTTPTTYTARATYMPCAGGVPVVKMDDIFVGVALPVIQIDSLRNISCDGLIPGAAYASFSSSSAVLSYGWTPGGTPNVTTLTSSTSGVYVFTVTTTDNCVNTDTITILGPGSLLVTVPDSIVIDCNPLGSFGVLKAIASGGNPLGNGYSFAWSNGQTGASATGLADGVYTVTLTDGDGCVVNGSGTVVSQISLLNFDQPQLTNLICIGGDDGQIIVSINNAVPPINFNWSNGLPNTDTLIGLPASIYTVTASDANGCTVTATITITEPTAIALTIDCTPTILGQATGTAVVTAQGGTVGNGYTYNWSAGGATTTNVGNLAEGIVTVTVTDGNNCTASADCEVQFTVNVKETAAGINALSVYPNPSNGLLNLNVELANTSALTIVISDVRGAIVFTTNETTTTSYHKGFDLSHLAKGMYNMSIKTDKGVVNKQISLQ